MNFNDALEYIVSKKISPTYINNNSPISFSTARRLLKSDKVSSTPHADTQANLINFVENYKKQYDSNNKEDFLDRLEGDVDEHFAELMTRSSFRKNIHIEVLKLCIKAQTESNVVNVDTLSKAINNS